MNKRIINALASENISGQDIAGMSVPQITALEAAVTGLGPVSIEILLTYRLEQLALQSTNISAVREALLASSQITEDLKKLSTYSRDTVSALGLNLGGQLVTAFLENPFYDRELEQFFTLMPIMESHNVVATLSYRIKDYGLTTLVPYELEMAKLILSATIVDTYLEIHGASKIVQKRKWKRDGTTYNYDVAWLGDPSVEAAKQSTTFGIWWEPGKAPKASRIKAKAGVVGKRTPKKFVKMCVKLACQQHRLAIDVDQTKLMEYLMNSKEMLSIKAGEFLIKGRKYGARERKAMIAERVAETTARYQAEIDIWQEMLTRQIEHNLPLHHSFHFEYRGRVQNDNTSLLLNPQGKVGKIMWEAYTPRVLNTIDYKWLCFSVVAEIKRVNPDNAVALFEADTDNLVAQYMDTDDYLEQVYRTRVIDAINNYHAGKQDSTYIFRDYTNGGAIHFASGLTREPQAIKVNNLLAQDEVYDTHSMLMESFNAHTGLSATRKDIKDAVSQGITAGITPESAIKKIKEYFIETHNTKVTISISDYKDIVRDVYGKTGELFHEYNKWGNDLIDNQHTALYSKTKDGFPTMSIAYIAGQEMNIYYPSIRTRGDHLHQVKLTRNMPMYFIIDGTTKQEGRTRANFKPMCNGPHAVAHRYGFLANTTHGHLDAVAIRAHMWKTIELGTPGLFIHDNIGTVPMVQEAIEKVAQADVLENYKILPFALAAVQAAEGRKKFHMSQFVLSEDTTFDVGKNFLQP